MQEKTVMFETWIERGQYESSLDKMNHPYGPGITIEYNKHKQKTAF